MTIVIEELNLKFSKRTYVGWIYENKIGKYIHERDVKSHNVWLMLLTGETHGEINFLTLFCNYVFLLHCCCSVDNVEHVFCFTLSRNI